MSQPLQCPRTGAPLADVPAEGPLRCVRCQLQVVAGEGPAGHYWCGSSGSSTEDSLDLGDTVYTADEGVAEGPESAQDLPGYHLGEILGRGGAGVVYRARRESDGRACALKLLAAGSWSSLKQRARFQREIDALRGFRDPGVVEILDAGEAPDGGPWYAMALIEGPTLHEVLAERGVLPAAEAARVTRALGETLARLHARGVYHRDVKPGNVLMTRDGQPLLSDFGLVLDKAVTERLTRTHQMLGTPRYMAPEQLMGSVDDWARADIYALGVVLYECLGGEVRRSLSGVHTVEPVDGAPADLLWIARRASAFEPGDRYAQVVELAEDIARWQARRPVRRRPKAMAWEGRRWLSRNRVAVGVVSALALALGGSQGWRALQDARGERAAWADWEAASLGMQSARAAGDEDAAEALFIEFTEDPSRQGRAALGAAWVSEAEWRFAQEQWEPARAAYGEAWLATPDPEQRERVLLGLAELYDHTASWGPLGALLEVASALSPGIQIPDAARLRAEVAVAERDIAAATRSLPPAESAVVAPLAQVTWPEARWAMPLDLDGDGRAELIEKTDLRGPDGQRATPTDALCAGCWRMLGEPERPMVWQDSEIYERRDQGWVALTDKGDVGVYKAIVTEGRLFYATGVSERRIWEAREGQQLPAHPPTDALTSYVESFSAGDLDGDGVKELVVCVGAPVGYVTRVFGLREPGAGDAGGTLELLAEAALGKAVANVFDTPNGPRIAVMVVAERPSTAVVSDAEHEAHRARLHVLKYEDGRLIEDTSQPVSPLYEPNHLSVSDMDGDGRVDLIADGRWYPIGGPGWTRASLVWLQDERGQLKPPLRLWGLSFEGPLELDGDPEPEHVWSTGPHRDDAVITGAGEGSLPQTRRPSVRLREEGDVLGALGLHEAAALTWQRIAARQPTRAREAWRAAERWWAAAGQPAEAASAAEAAAFAGDAPALPDLSRAIDHAIDAHAHQQALQLAERLAALAPELEAQRLVWLRGFDAPDLDLDLTKPLGPAWTVHVPKAVRHDMLEGTLTLTPATGRGAILELALKATGGPIWMHATMDWLRAEWGTDFYLRLRKRGVEGVVDQLMRFGSGLGGGFQGRDLNEACRPGWSVSSAEGADHLQLRVAESREGDRFVGACDVDGRALRGEVPRHLERVAGDAVTLRFESQLRWPRGQIAELRLSELQLGGLVLDPEPPEVALDPWVAWSRGLGPLPAEAPSAALAALLRQDPALGRRIEDALGPEVYGRVFAEAWEAAASVHHADPLVQEAMLELPPMEGVPAESVVPLLVAQGEARWRAGDVEGARASLERAIALSTERGWQSAWQAEVLLAELALALGDADLAAEHVRAAAELAPDPALGWRMLRQRARLAEVVEAGAPK